MGWKKTLSLVMLLGTGFLLGTLAGFFVFYMPMERVETPQENLAVVVAGTPQPSPTLPPLPTPTPKEEKSRFLLTLSGEAVCIYELLPGGKTLLLQETGIKLDHLRQEDYENLCKGYTVQSLEEAKALCEDFEG